jgi:hypothetical protein
MAARTACAACRSKKSAKRDRIIHIFITHKIFYEKIYFDIFATHFTHFVGLHVATTKSRDSSSESGS